MIHAAVLNNELEQMYVIVQYYMSTYMFVLEKIKKLLTDVYLKKIFLYSTERVLLFYIV